MSDRGVGELGPSLGEVDAAVRSVLFELRAASPAPVRPSPPTVVAKADSELFAGRLLSLSAAEGFDPRVRSIRVAPGTVVTPLARDHLKRLGIELRFGSGNEVERLRNRGEWGLALATTSGLIEALRRSLLDGADSWQELDADLERVADWLLDGPGRGVLYVTDESALAVHLVASIAGIRAASACDPDHVARAVRSIGVNLVAVEPSGRPLGLLRQMAATFRRAGGPVCPPGLLSRNGGAS